MGLELLLAVDAVESSPPKRPPRRVPSSPVELGAGELEDWDWGVSLGVAEVTGLVGVRVGERVELAEVVESPPRMPPKMFPSLPDELLEVDCVVELLVDSSPPKMPPRIPSSLEELGAGELDGDGDSGVSLGVAEDVGAAEEVGAAEDVGAGVALELSGVFESP